MGSEEVAIDVSAASIDSSVVLSSTRASIRAGLPAHASCRPDCAKRGVLRATPAQAAGRLLWRAALRGAGQGRARDCRARAACSFMLSSEWMTSRMRRSVPIT